jgi:hypothetical protein
MAKVKIFDLVISYDSRQRAEAVLPQIKKLARQYEGRVSTSHDVIDVHCLFQDSSKYRGFLSQFRLAYPDYSSLDLRESELESSAA